jgi:hypothetical protein
MIIDCESCEVRGNACGDCVIGVLLGASAPEQAGDEPVRHPSDTPSGAPIVQLDAPERRAIDVLADQGLVPRLRLVAAPTRRATSDVDDARSVRDAG